MSAKAQKIRAAVEQYADPYLGQTLLEAGALAELRVGETEIGGTVELGVPVRGYVDQFRAALAAQLAAAGFPGLRVAVELRSAIVAHGVQRPLKPLPGVSNIIAVASGKGGVGKSTVAVNLALAWAAGGARVGILDADIYGPSQPMMLGLGGQRPTAPDGKHLVPLQAHGVKAMSIGFLVDAAQAVVWRGPMVTQALTQLLGDTSWGELDYLVVDMPPGTGDVQLTLAQRVPVSGALIVTTPQDIALADARKGLGDVREGRGTGTRDRREHEPARVLELRAYRAYFRRRRRRSGWPPSRACSCSARCRLMRASARRPTAACPRW